MNRVERQIALYGLCVFAAKNDEAVSAEFKQRLGKCYELSVKYVQAHPDFKLIHGTIRGVGVEDDRRINHAWCERGQTVYDPVLGRPMPKWLYYEQFSPRVEKSYTKEEALINLIKRKYYGKWH